VIDPRESEVDALVDEARLAARQRELTDRPVVDSPSLELTAARLMEILDALDGKDQAQRQLGARILEALALCDYAAGGPSVET
jgi:hypothetical protein